MPAKRKQKKPLTKEQLFQRNRCFTTKGRIESVRRNLMSINPKYLSSSERTRINAAISILTAIMNDYDNTTKLITKET